MLNKESIGAEFVICYGEMSAAYNERMIGFDYKKELDKIWNDEFFAGKLKWDDIGEIGSIFEEEFNVVENEYRYLEVEAIMEWLDNKRNLALSSAE
jgi:hypothetical protein